MRLENFFCKIVGHRKGPYIASLPVNNWQDGNYYLVYEHVLSLFIKSNSPAWHLQVIYLDLDNDEITVAEMRVVPAGKLHWIKIEST